MMLRPSPLLLVLVAAACAGRGGGRAPAPTPVSKPPPPPAATTGSQPAEATRVERKEPVVPPALAYMEGLMPLRSTGVDEFRAAHPTYDGRGVVIGILDSGIDAGTPGLVMTSTGAPKILDLRDFSGEGRVVLTRVEPAAVRGAGRIARLAVGGGWYAGVFRELPLGKLPASDVNGNGTNTDVFPVVVVKAIDGWVAFLDSNLDGSFEDEMPLHDYRQGRETIALGTRPLSIVANFGGSDTAPTLDLLFDTSGHGTHVAGIAAGHDLFNISAFDGVAPGAQLLGLKIANNARGGVSVHGSMLRAMDYAARFAERSNMPLVLNMSFGIGNEHEGRAVIDSLVNAFLKAHPAVVLAVSAGNDGPGLSTLGFPGSADLGLSVGSLYPGPFAKLPQPGEPRPPDVLAWFSARGGELNKPDVVTPGVAYSAVPAWETGSEVKGGTSMSAPYAAGLVACLVSALAQEDRRVSAAELMGALRVSARRFPGAGPLDQGSGVPQLEAAYRWLEAGHQGSTYVVRASSGASAAYRRNGLAGPADTLEVFRLRHVGGLRAAQFRLRSDVPWLSAPAVVSADPRTTEIPVVYRAAALAAPGLYVGTVTGRNLSDTLGAPVFTLVNTVIVPHDLRSRPLSDERRTILPGGVQRYFFATPPGATLQILVSLPDSAQRAAARLYEPNGQPARASEEIALGKDDPASTRLTVRAEDVVGGVYELDVVAIPLDTVTATVRVELGPLALAAAPGGKGTGVEVSTIGASTVGARVSHVLVGAERAFAVAGRGAPPESLPVRVPQWAARAEIDVGLAPEQWDEFTDFAVTAFDSSGQVVSGTPFDYALGRHAFDVPDTLRGHPLTVELFPAYARPPEAAHPWQGSVRVRFLLAQPRPASGGGDLSVVAGGRVRLPRAEPPPLELPDGFQPLIESHLRSATGPESVYRGPVSTAAP